MKNDKFNFRVSARTILQLGAELISSDAIAFYELIKNSFDAYYDEDAKTLENPKVNISVVSRMDFEVYQNLRKELSEFLMKDNVNLRECQEKVLAEIREVGDSSNKNIKDKTKKFRRDIGSAESVAALIDCLDEVNYIEISDEGVGMSRKDLEDVYLTVGTSHRARQKASRKKDEQKNNDIGYPILGEKGIGRLSTMRLGMRLHVESTKKGDDSWNVMSIDWAKFSENISDLVEDVKVDISQGIKKDDTSESGTLVHIYRLNSEWKKEKLERITKEELSKLIDPFGVLSKKKYFPINLSYNGETIHIERFKNILFENAHAQANATFALDEEGNPILYGKINYKYRKRDFTFEYEGTHLNELAGKASIRVLKSLGPFSMELIWYNRIRFASIEDKDDRTLVKELIKAWSGGLMLFRDGFRVYPYGGPNDDWLDIDKAAFSSKGYKMNRQQIIGKVDISSALNPKLSDKTNREGLVDCEEKDALVSILQHVILTELKTFVEDIDKEYTKPDKEKFEYFVKSAEQIVKKLDGEIKGMLDAYPIVKEDKETVERIYDIIDELNIQLQNTRMVSETFEDERKKVLHLAGLGLMVEIVAHELNRTTDHTLSVIEKSGNKHIDDKFNLDNLLDILKTQLKTLQKRLRILDPLSTAGRQVMEKFDFPALVKATLNTHEAQFDRHKIDSTLVILPYNDSSLNVKMVKGMIVQIIENLLSNSIYWLKQQANYERDFKPMIRVTVDTKRKILSIEDNGPGVNPALKERIFEPFYSTKPAKEMKGLGLYISREIADYHSVSLYLSEKTTVHENNLNTFILDFGEKRQ